MVFFNQIHIFSEPAHAAVSCFSANSFEVLNLLSPTRLRGSSPDDERRDSAAGCRGEFRRGVRLRSCAVRAASPAGGRLQADGAGAGQTSLHGDWRWHRLHPQRHHLHPGREELLHHYRCDQISHFQSDIWNTFIASLLRNTSKLMGVNKGLFLVLSPFQE